MKVAVPQYMRDMQQAAPGHRFGMYFPIWNDQWEITKDKKADAIKKVLALHPDDQKRQQSLAQRQQFQALALGDTVCSEYAVATAPFATGMGYEHPLENGFAFLNPYGLPYLPGSSVKGVMLRATEELGVDVGVVDELFGSAEDGSQGALSFWDVFPQGTLALDIMTPHHSAYLQGGTASPHDSESPVPIPFLTVAPGAQFVFHVQMIRPTGILDWQVMLTQCFEHAFDWLGFGAKTSVGYGAMMHDRKAQENAGNARIQAEEEARKAAMSPFDREMEVIVAKGDSAIGDLLKGLESGQWEGEDACAAARILKQLLESNGSWLPEFSGSNKIKKKKHERTLKVMRYLAKDAD